jgi:hypothetical protein
MKGAPVWMVVVLATAIQSCYALFIWSDATPQYFNERREIPQYITDYAPVVRLYSEEKYLPYDVVDYVTHFTLKDSSRQNVSADGGPLSLSDLGLVQALSSESPLYLSSLEDFSLEPEWLTGSKNIPDIDTGTLKNAPAVLIVMDKGGGVVDSFWFFFYSFNLGPFVMGSGPYGNHIGDWEHCLIRFKNKEPELLWMSAHGGGSAYYFEAMEKYEKDDNRPVLFAARGTHANYATAGQHSHDIPYHMLSDFTDRGPLWDVKNNYLAYVYDGSNVYPSNGTDPTREMELGGWLTYLERWGDQKLLPEDPRQSYHPFEWRMIDGPTGPLTKNLDRQYPCQRSKWWNFFKTCKVRRQLVMGEGIEGEGGTCARVLDRIHPKWLSWLLTVVLGDGYICLVVDRLWG